MTTTIDERHLNRSWTTMKAALQYVRRNNLDLAALGHELREWKREHGIVVDIQPIAIADSMSSYSPAPTAPHTPAAEVLPQHRPGRFVPPATPAPVAAPEATSNGHRMVLICEGTEDGLWPADVFEMWAWKIARKMLTPVEVFDGAGNLVLRATAKKPKAPRAAGSGPRAGKSSENEPIILRMLQAPGGSTATEIRTALGWKAIAAEAYLSKFCQKRNLRLVITKTDRRADTRYGIEADKEAA